MRILYSRCAWGLAAGLLVGTTWAEEGKVVSPKSQGVFSLANYQDQGTVVAEKTTVTTTTTSTGGGHGIAGPISLRGTEAYAPGVFTFENWFGWGTTRNSSDDRWNWTLVLEYGLAENHQLILAMPVELGDGKVEGSWDVTFGWHWKLWNEDGGMPSAAIRQFIRVPNGWHSDGVDYEIRPILTWTVSDSAHFTLSGYARSNNGDLYEVEDEDGVVVVDGRHFRWGIITGMDYDLSDDLKLIWDYVYGNSTHEGNRDNHSLEVGLDWHFAENHCLGFATEVSLDGDSNENASLGAKVNWVIQFGG